MGQLQLEEELGKGNYGTVKRVLHTPTNVYMAMKVRFFMTGRVMPQTDVHLLSTIRKSDWN